MKLTFRSRVTEEPLAAVAVAAVGDTARALAAAVLRRGENELRALRGSGAVGEQEVILLLGPSDSLPWCDGAIYLGRDECAPALLLPTTLVSVQPLPLVERALLRHAKARTVAVLPLQRLLVPLDDARPLSRDQLARLSLARPSGSTP